jgi:hypothetical protein
MVNVTVATAGLSGPRGNGWFEGSGAPSDSVGLPGDFYLDQANINAPTYYGPKSVLNTWVGTGPYTFSSSGVSSVTAADSSIVVGGSGSAPTVRTGTLDVIATDHPPAGAWSNNGQKITGVANGTVSTDVAAFGQLPLSTPWIFNVLSSAYGAVGDGKFVTDGAMSTGVAILTSVSANFTSGDVGKSILVKGAGAAGVTTLVATIASFPSVTQVTLSTVNASGGNVTAALAMWATDDTAHIQSAINAALTYAGTHGSATVFFPVGAGRFYGIAGALQQGGSTLGNAQLTIGAPVATTANKLVLSFEGAVNGSALEHWQQLSPQLNGSTLVSFGVFASSSAQTNSINANGNAAVIGGPTQPNGYGISPGIFSNMLVTLNRLSILTTHSADGYTYGAADFSGVAEANIFDFAYGTAGSVADGDYTSPNLLANGLSAGLLMPANGNNDNNAVRNLSCHGGYTYALFATEHTVIDRLCILYCWSALCLVGTYFGSVGSAHGVNVVQASIEACTNIVYVIGAGSSGIGPYLFATISTESGQPTFSGNSSTAMNAALGVVTLTGLFTVSGITVTYPTGLRVVNGQQACVTTAITSASSPYTVTALDQKVLIDASGGNVVVDLFSAAWTGNEFTFVRLDSSGNTVTITANGIELIHVSGSGAATTATMTGQYSKLSLFPARVSSVWGWYNR